MTGMNDADNVWHFGETVPAAGAGELRDVRVTSTGEPWMVGGAVDPETGRERGLVGRWTGVFQPVPPTKGAADVRLVGMDVTDEDVWAVGRSFDHTGHGRAHAERYSRSADVPTGEVVEVPDGDDNGALRGVFMRAGDDGWAVGSVGDSRTLITRWDGEKWDMVPSPSPGVGTNQLEAVAGWSGSDLWAVGHSTDESGLSAALALHWDGRSWSHIPVPTNGTEGRQLLGVAVTGPNSVWVAGTRGVAAGPQIALALYWDGATWHDIPVDDAAATKFNAVTASSGTDVWFAGYAQSGSGLGSETAHIEHWGGDRLVRQTIVRPGLGTREYPASGISAIAVVGDRRVAVGWQILTSAAERLPVTIIGPGALPSADGSHA